MPREDNKKEYKQLLDGLMEELSSRKTGGTRNTAPAGRPDAPTDRVAGESMAYAPVEERYRRPNMEPMSQQELELSRPDRERAEASFDRSRQIGKHRLSLAPVRMPSPGGHRDTVIPTQAPGEAYGLMPYGHPSGPSHEGRPQFGSDAFRQIRGVSQERRMDASAQNRRLLENRRAGREERVSLSSSEQSTLDYLLAKQAGMADGADK